MIIVRAPLRISFVGGGSDLPSFYQMSPGKVISATIDKYVYTAINPAPLLKGISARYSVTENVDTAVQLKNDRMRETMLHFGVKDNMEIGTFSHLRIGTGLGASSAFTVSLVKGFSTYLGKRLDKKDIAKIACNIEINLIKEPIGKQDQYASTFGGFNIFQFNPDETVDIDPVLLDYKKRIDLENRMLVFFTGITRQASSILKEQRRNIQNNYASLKSMVNLVEIFRKKLIQGNFQYLGKLLHEGWLKKRQLSSKISNQVIDDIYNSGIKNGAWGGKLLGAGGGGCILFLVPLSNKEKVRQAVKRKAQKIGLKELKEVPIKFIHSGVEVVSNSLF